MTLHWKKINNNKCPKCGREFNPNFLNNKGPIFCIFSGFRIGHKKFVRITDSLIRDRQSGLSENELALNNFR